jgi:hypothetical protein
MANRQPEGDVFGAASLRRELKEAREESDQAKTLLEKTLLMVRARTGDYQLTDRFCLRCHKQYLHSGPDNCQCICHEAHRWLKAHPTQAMVWAPQVIAFWAAIDLAVATAKTEARNEAARAAAVQQVDEGQADDGDEALP